MMVWRNISFVILSADSALSKYERPEIDASSSSIEYTYILLYCSANLGSKKYLA